MVTLGEKKKYVWFRWPDPTYFFRPTANVFFFIWIRKQFGPIFYSIFEKIAKNVFKAFM